MPDTQLLNTARARLRLYCLAERALLVQLPEMCLKKGSGKRLRGDEGNSSLPLCRKACEDFYAACRYEARCTKLSSGTCLSSRFHLEILNSQVYLQRIFEGQTQSISWEASSDGLYDPCRACVGYARVQEFAHNRLILIYYLSTQYILFNIYLPRTVCSILHIFNSILHSIIIIYPLLKHVPGASRT